MTERSNHITAEFVPSPEVLPPPDKIVVKAPNDKRGFPIFHDLHLTVEQAIELDDAICAALAVYEDRKPNA
jgi:hypothetical protein